MAYPRRCHTIPSVASEEQTQFYQKVQNFVDRIPDTRHDNPDVLCPFKYDISIPTIVSELLRFTDGSNQTNAVYILECRRSMSISDAVELNISSRSAMNQMGRLQHNPGRVLYVGSTSNLLRRLDEHLNSPADDGAYITAMCPPLRVLAVEWFMSRHRAYRGESLAAKLLEDCFPEDVICFPG
jgi:predicted GIY-YIG superfamily endonuclease